ncbi:hypothetical protein GCM10011405_37320 [Rufibacter glacialis]|nr:M23 family metallopeptidase [Rufibacter glacialis]GGK86055.1 hypothetical protein GCM10011405_37320 [Rufibacter glacialis]
MSRIKNTVSAAVVDEKSNRKAIAQAAIYTEWFFTGQVDSLWHSVSEKGRKRFPNTESISTLRQRVIPVITGFEKVLSDSVVQNDTLVSVWRYGINKGDGVIYYVKWSLTPNDHRIVGFSASDAGRVAVNPKKNYKVRTKLQLPVKGEWIVFWGGPTVKQNYHAAYSTQQFALDLMPAADSARTWQAAKGEALALTDFACYGSPVFAPAAGKVVVAIDSIPDNQVGKFHPTSEKGNYLIIEHQKGEFSLLGHLKQNSIKVKVGDEVKAGAEVAQCGNSGRTTSPHLHFDLIDKPNIGRGTLSLPAKFYHYKADSVLIKIGQPLQWQRIKPAFE